MTSEYTELSGRWWGAEPGELLRDASCLLWDFDGPLCGLFAQHSATDVVVTLCHQLVALGLPAEAAKWRGTHDPLGILRSQLPSGVAAVLEELTAAEEEKAASKADPTPGADQFVRRMKKRGCRLAITSNNAPRAVEAYLAAHDLEECFGDRVFGRVPESPQLMKPHPHCLERAIEKLGVLPNECLMIGDSVMDALAAAEAGVPFLGYARHEEAARSLRAAAHVPDGVIGMAPLLWATRHDEP
ncbi:HAD family hydrolase [Actinacidiphila acidipaludis]|uniref:HAD-IA family hydrolase n=1 Tax=Actinacidiphila acidipaludis TaxID=2873382 RepID=A0ABS7QE24_9ACTN|nr:HAD-IA family hydrolase [Streptomyces acidipaludis]MBY8880939.1 HAD-IA family hydrolase [Streptomyces acidipaludis]